MLMGDSEDERDRERDDHESQRERDEEHYRERSVDRGRTRVPAKRTVEVNKATPDNTDPHIEEGQVADAVPTPQDTFKETQTISRVRSLLQLWGRGTHK